MNNDAFLAGSCKGNIDRIFFAILSDIGGFPGIKIEIVLKIKKILF
jgi:hypothetical protein